MVSETVAAAKGWARARSASGFLNAVLRKAVNDRSHFDKAPVTAVWPDWLTVEMMTSLGIEAATALAEAQSVAATALEGLVSSVFGPPDQISWDRKLLSGLPMAVVMTGLRRAILATGRIGADTVSRQSLVAASDGIGDHRSHPRTYEVGGGLVVLVDARQVKIQMGAS